MMLLINVESILICEYNRYKSLRNQRQIIMDFSDMGSLDAQNEVKKSGIDTSKGELKAATIRGTAPFLDLLTHVAEKMGMSRQAFMSKLIEQKVAEAAAEYLSGYASYMRLEDIDASMFLEDADEIDSQLLNNFAKQVEDSLFQMQLSAEGFNALPDSNPLKQKQAKAFYDQIGATYVKA